MTPVTIVYFCYGWTLWRYLAWIPSFYVHTYGLDLKKSAWFSAGVFFAGVVGDTMGGIVSDCLFKHDGQSENLARRDLIFKLPISLGDLDVTHTLGRDLNWVSLFLSVAFFFSEFTIGMMWAIPRYRSTVFQAQRAGS